MLQGGSHCADISTSPQNWMALNFFFNFDFRSLISMFLYFSSLGEGAVRSGFYSGEQTSQKTMSTLDFKPTWLLSRGCMVNFCRCAQRINSGPTPHDTHPAKRLIWSPFAPLCASDSASGVPAAPSPADWSVWSPASCGLGTESRGQKHDYVHVITQMIFSILILYI